MPRSTSPRRQRNTYKHRLIGFDEAWVDDGPLHRATYTNLAPGDYVFQVMAANNDGVWSTQPMTLNLRANPAPWATPLAKAGYLLLALGALLLMYRALQPAPRSRAADPRYQRDSCAPKSKNVRRRNAR